MILDFSSNLKDLMIWIPPTLFAFYLTASELPFVPRIPPGHLPQKKKRRDDRAFMVTLSYYSRIPWRCSSNLNWLTNKPFSSWFILTILNINNFSVLSKSLCTGWALSVHFTVICHSESTLVFFQDSKQSRSPPNWLQPKLQTTYFITSSVFPSPMMVILGHWCLAPSWLFEGWNR